MNMKRILLLLIMILLSIAVVSCDGLFNNTTTTEATTTAATATSTEATTVETTTQTTTQTTTTQATTTETTTQITTTEATTEETTTETTLSDLEILQNAANTVLISNSDNMLENFYLPAEVRGMTVVWESNNTDVIAVSATTTSIDGLDGLFYEMIVTRPNQTEGTATVTITGTFYYNDSTYEKDFVIRVPALEDSSIVTTIAEGLALDYETYITWKDMTVIGIGRDGFFFTDGIDILYVFNTTYLETLIVGNVYDIVGSVKLYYSIPEVQNIAENVVMISDSTAAAKSVTPTVATISEIIANHQGYDDDNPMEPTIYTVTAKVY